MCGQSGLDRAGIELDGRDREALRRARDERLRLAHRLDQALLRWIGRRVGLESREQALVELGRPLGDTALVVEQ